jgi:hypothetical protein
MDLVELGVRSMDLVDLEFLELRCLARKIWSGAILLKLELLGALPNTPLMLARPAERPSHCHHLSLCQTQAQPLKHPLRRARAYT